MNNKQKAAEMVLAYLAIVGHNLALAKECAVRAAEEVLNQYDIDHDPVHFKGWENVIKEIKNII
jgi:hypothetical protein